MIPRQVISSARLQARSSPPSRSAPRPPAHVSLDTISEVSAPPPASCQGIDPMVPQLLQGHEIGKAIIQTLQQCR